MAKLTASSARHESDTLWHLAFEAAAHDDDQAANHQACERDDLDSALTDPTWSALRRGI
jgi:hypothetical protein